MPRRTDFRTWDDYFIQGTTVLRNLFTSPTKPYGETDPSKLRRLEELLTRDRIAELRAEPIAGEFGYDHMKAIHRHVFQDVYEWAGEERTAPAGHFMTKNGHSYYPAGASLTAAAEAEYEKLARANLLRGLEQDQFTNALAESWGEINVVHSFREGNTRTQFVLFERLCAQAGYMLDIERFAKDRDFRDRFVAARFHSQDTGRNDQLAEVLGEVV